MRKRYREKESAREWVREWESEKEKEKEKERKLNIANKNVHGISIYLPSGHTSETFFPHLFLNIEMYLNFQQKLLN